MPVTDHPASFKPSLTLVPASSIQQARDIHHAETLLRESGSRAAGSELRRLARQVVQGTLLLIREDVTEPLDDIHAVSQAPLLTTLMVLG